MLLWTDGAIKWQEFQHDNSVHRPCSSISSATLELCLFRLHVNYLRFCVTRSIPHADKNASHDIKIFIFTFVADIVASSSLYDSMNTFNSVVGMEEKTRGKQWFNAGGVGDKYRPFRSSTKNITNPSLSKKKLWTRKFIKLRITWPRKSVNKAVAYTVWKSNGASSWSRSVSC